MSNHNVKFSTEDLSDFEIKVLDNIGFLPRGRNPTLFQIITLDQMLIKQGKRYIENFNEDIITKRIKNDFILNDIWHLWMDAIHTTEIDFLKTYSEFKTVYDEVLENELKFLFMKEILNNPRFSQRYLSEVLDVSETYMSLLSTRKKPISKKILKKLNDLYEGGFVAYKEKLLKTNFIQSFQYLITDELLTSALKSYFKYSHIDGDK